MKKKNNFFLKLKKSFFVKKISKNVKMPKMVLKFATEQNIDFGHIVDRPRDRRMKKNMRAHKILFSSQHQCYSIFNISESEKNNDN